MRYFEIIPKDQRYNNWIFHYEHPENGILYRKRYIDLQCKKCGKVDERRALASGMDDDVKIRSQSDWLETDDGIVCLSRRAQLVLNEGGATGFELIHLPGDDSYSILSPSILCKVDMDMAGFEPAGDQCPACGRFEGLYVGPMFSSLELPEAPLCIFSPEKVNEDRWGAKTRLYAGEAIIKVLKKAKLSGVEFMEPL